MFSVDGMDCYASLESYAIYGELLLTVAMPGYEVTRPHIRNMHHRCFEVEVRMEECVDLLAVTRGCTLEECLGVLSDDHP